MSVLKRALVAFEAAQGRGREENVAADRCVRTWIVNNLLESLPRDEVKGKAGQELDITLSILKQCDTEPIPEVFSFSNQISRDFTFWLQSRLVRLYTSPGLQAHHSNVRLVHTKILAVIKQRDVRAYSQLLHKLIRCLTVMCEGAEGGKAFEVCLSNTHIVQPDRNVEDPLLEQSMTLIDIQIDTGDQLRLLELNLLLILMEEHAEIAQYCCPSIHHELLKSVDTLLRYSHFSIKDLGLELLAKLKFWSSSNEIPIVLRYDLICTLSSVLIHQIEHVSPELDTPTLERLHLSMDPLFCSGLAVELAEGISRNPSIVLGDDIAGRVVMEILGTGLDAPGVESSRTLALFAALNSYNCADSPEVLQSLIEKLLVTDIKFNSEKSISFSTITQTIMALCSSHAPLEIRSARLHYAAHWLAHCVLQADRNGCSLPTDDLLAVMDSVLKSYREMLRLSLVNQIYLDYCNTVAAFLFIKDKISLPKEVYVEMYQILALVYIDVIPVDTSYPTWLRSLSPRLQPTPAVYIASLRALMLLPRHADSSWTLSLIPALLGGSLTSIDAHLLLQPVAENLPYMYLERGQAAQALIRKLHTVISQHQPVCQALIASNCGRLACILEGAASLTTGDYTAQPVWNTMRIACTKCDSPDLKGSSCRLPAEKILDPALFSPFMSYLTHNADVKFHFTHSLVRIFTHLRLCHTNGDAMSMLCSSLSLLSDPEFKVRQAYCQLVRQAFAHSSMDVIGPVLDRILSLSDEAEDDLKETLVMTVVALGSNGDNTLFGTCVKYLVDVYMCASPLLSMLAFHHLAELASLKNLSVNEVYKRNQALLTECITEKVIRILSSKYIQGVTVVDLFVNASNLFQYKSVTHYLTNQERYLIPHIITADHKDVNKVLKLFAELVNRPYHQLLSSNIPFIYAHLVRVCSRADVERKISFLEQETRQNIGTLMRLNFQQLLNQLLLCFGSREKQIKYALSYLMMQDAKYQTSQPITDSQISDFIETHLLGVLVFFDQTLLTKATSTDKKANVVRSIMSIIRLLGPSKITPLRIKISTSLKLAMKSKEAELALLCCEAWEVFVQHVDKAALGSMLSLVAVTLLELVTVCPRAVAQVFKYLIVKCRRELGKYFPELYFIPDIPELVEVNTTLKHELEYSRKSDGFAQSLKQYLAGIRHDNKQVCKQALIKLKALLADNKKQLHQMINGSETVDPVITQCMQTLTYECIHSDADAHILYADCLAELGAVDPGKMDLVSEKYNSNCSRRTKKLDKIDEPEFLLNYMTTLVTALLSADTSQEQDCIALAVQGTLALYKIQNDEKNQTWKLFSPEVQDVVSPYVDSKYILSNPNFLKVVSPIYKSSKGDNYKDWLCNWAAIIASKVEDGFAKELFQSCAAAISTSTSIAMFMLPYLITYLAAEQKYSQLVLDEITVVLNDAQTANVSEFCHLALQTVFSILDDLTAWINSPHVQQRDDEIDLTDDFAADRSVLEAFLGEFSHELISRAALNCQNYARSLLHYERSMEGSNVQPHLDMLQEIYSSMGEPDGVAGVDSLREKPATLHQQAIIWENFDRLSDAMICYEEAVNIDPQDAVAHEGLMKSYLDLGNWYLALSHSPVACSRHDAFNEKLLGYKVEAAWKLGDWDKLKSLLETESQSVGWEVRVGRLLLAARDKNVADFESNLHDVKQEIMGPLCAASMEGSSLQRGYSYLIRLHMLNDIETAGKLVFFNQEPNTESHISTLVSQLNERYNMVQSSVRTREPVVTLRQSLLQLAQYGLPAANLDRQRLQCWLQRASAARQANQLVNAYGSLEKAARFGQPEREVEKARIFWQRGDATHAQTCLERIINSHYNNIPEPDIGQATRAERLAVAEVYVLLASYSEANSSFERSEVRKSYDKAILICPDWEDGYFHLAAYYDRFLAGKSSTSNMELYWRVYKQATANFAFSLRYGSKNVYQSMSRVLSLWLDLASEISKKDKDPKNKVNLSKHKATLDAIHSDCIRPMVHHVAAFQWLTSFSQLTSRVCLTHQAASLLLQELIAQLITKYPQHTMWSMMSISKSSHTVRRDNCQLIFDKARQLSPQSSIYLKDITKLTDRLHELTNHEVKQRSIVHLSVFEHFRFLKRLLDDPNFSQIMLPIQSAMTITLPADADSNGMSSSFNAFPTSVVFLSGFEDKVDVLVSMIRPKKLTMVGSDGKLYPFLCKPKDDLRKDAKLMEFTSIINKLLRKDAQCRRMQLHIRTYSVVPLSEACGLIEWVDGCTAYRKITVVLSKQLGCYTSFSEISQLYKPLSSKSSLAVRMPIFRKARDKHHPVLHIWFLQTFPDPTAWYNARVAYSRTLAVMSMVGYVMGLGDRHGENLLLHSTSGDVMHVDFDCLFNKGLTFEYPEVVPFRLTRNMVQAMGPTGYEGIFRKAAESTLRVMKQTREQLMSVLRPFIYDPLVEWSKKKSKKASETGEVVNEQAMTTLQSIENRLADGLSSQEKGLHLSIEGHVRDLIDEATDENNLCQMFVGWAPYN